jgi:hypothetical protein
MPPKQAGRPRKSDTEGTPQQIKRREYQRKYQSQIKAGIEALEQDEIDCLEELDRIRKEKSRLIDEIAKANEQANMILQEKVARPAGGVKKKVAPPKPSSIKFSDDDWYSAYLRKDAGTQLSAVAKRAVTQKKK